MQRNTPLAFVAVAAATLALAAPAARAITVDFFDRTTPDANGFIADGGDDHFDGGDLGVNGFSYLPAADPSGSLPHFTLAPQTVGGIDVSGRVDLFSSNGTTSANTRAPGLADFVYARQFYTFTNPTAAPAVAAIRFSYDLGSDTTTVVRSTSSGDTTITAADMWTVTDDLTDGGAAEDGSGQDPAVALLFVDGLALTPAALAFDPGGFVEADFNLPLAAGESRSLMLFVASRNETESFAGSASGAQSRVDVVALLNDPALQFNGLSPAEAARVANFAAVPEPSSLTLLALGGVALLRRRR